jgi:hypothetical protein
MTLLDPAAAIAAGLLAFPVLLVWYLLKLRRRPLRVSTTLFWRQSERDLQVNVPLRWLRLSWLLVLQALGLGLLVLALGRPALTGEEPVGRRVLLIVDRSASMSARDGADGATRLEEAKRLAVETARRLRRPGMSTSVGVISLGASARVEAPAGGGADAVVRAIRDIEPTDQPGNLRAALELAAALGAEGGASEEAGTASQTLILFSDGAFAGPPPAVAGVGELRLVRVGSGAGRDNLSVPALAASRDQADPTVLRLFARVENAGPEAVTAPLLLRVNGEVVERRAVLVPPAGPAGGNGGGEPVAFELRRAGGALVVLSIERPDMLDADNAAALVIAPASRPRVILVSPPALAAQAGRARPQWLLTDVLDEMELATLTRVSAEDYETLARGGAAGTADLVIFDGYRPRTPPAAPSLSFGAGVPLPGLDADPLPDEAAGDGGGFVLAWDRAHPALRDVALDSVFARGLVPLAAGDSPTPGVRVLAQTASGPAIVAGEAGGVRRLVVAFTPERSNWPLQVSFAIFLANAVDHLTLRARDDAGRAFTTGKPVSVRVRGPAPRATLRGPAVVEAPMPDAGDGDEARTVAFGLVERAGVYLVEPGVPAGEPDRIAVNLADRTESSLAVADAVRVSGRDVPATSGSPVPREIWPWLALAALGLLAVEWVVYAARSRL